MASAQGRLRRSCRSTTIPRNSTLCGAAHQSRLHHATSGGAIQVRVFSTVNNTIPDNTAAFGGGDLYTLTLTTTTSAKVLTLPMIRLYPGKIYLSIRERRWRLPVLHGGSNTVVVVPFDEAAN